MNGSRYKLYYNNKKQDPEWCQKRKEYMKKYYQENKIKKEIPITIKRGHFKLSLN